MNKNQDLGKGNSFHFVDFPYGFSVQAETPQEQERLKEEAENLFHGMTDEEGDKEEQPLES